MDSVDLTRLSKIIVEFYERLPSREDSGVCNSGLATDTLSVAVDRLKKQTPAQTHPPSHGPARLSHRTDPGRGSLFQRASRISPENDPQDRVRAHRIRTEHFCRCHWKNPEKNL